MVGLGLNFALLATYLFMRFFSWHPQGKTKSWLLLATFALTALIFLIAPYRSVPFRTTHQLEIIALDSDVKLVAVYSPDDNLIPREEFQTGEGVTDFAEVGFRLTPGSNLSYRRGQTGGLTLSFTADSGDMILTWDGTSHTFNPASVRDGEVLRINGWRAFVDSETGLSKISLPGYTWGDPDLFWTVLGALLPVADFISLASFIAIVAWIVLRVRQKMNITKADREWIRVWVDSLICIALAMVLIEIGFPDFIPFWFLLFFLPATAFLAYRQVQLLSACGDLEIKIFPALKHWLVIVGNTLKTVNLSRWTFWILIGIIAILAAASQIHLTAPGMGISGDSVHYLEGARNMAAGSGYVRHIAEGDPVVMTGFPPVYSSVLLPGIWIGANLEQFARYLNTILLVLTVILTGWIVFKITHKVMPAFWVTAFLVMAPPILTIYAWVMSEPLFLVLLLVTVLLWFWHIKRPTVWKPILIGVVAGIMTNTRLAGIAFVPVMVLGILIYQEDKFSRRLRDAALLAVTALIQPAAFFIRNSLVAGRISESRGLTVASFPHEYWEIIGAEVSSWFKWKTYFNLPHQRFNALFVTLGVLLLLIIGWLVFRKQLSASEKNNSVVTLLVLSIPVYLTVVVLNTILFTPNQTESGLTRYMIPILLILLILLGKLLNVYWKQPFLFPKVIILFVVLVGLQLYVIDSSDFISDPPLAFRHYTDRKNDCGNEVIEIVEDLPDACFYTNNCEYFFFLTGQRCRHLILETEAYQPGGEVYQAVREGDIIAFTPGFGTEPPGIWSYLNNLEHIDSGCYLEFYRYSENGD